MVILNSFLFYNLQLWLFLSFLFWLLHSYYLITHFMNESVLLQSRRKKQSLSLSPRFLYIISNLLLMYLFSIHRTMLLVIFKTNVCLRTNRLEINICYSRFILGQRTIKFCLDRIMMYWLLFMMRAIHINDFHLFLLKMPLLNRSIVHSHWLHLLTLTLIEQIPTMKRISLIIIIPLIPFTMVTFGWILFKICSKRRSLAFVL